MLAIWCLLSFVLGALAAALVARRALRGHVARIRAAERRARGAERLAELGAMTGGLAHEIKNPLSTIGLNAQLLEEGLGELRVDDAERSRLLRRVGALRREADRLRGILTDFLQYAGQVRLDPRPADLNRVVEELVDFFLPQATKAGVRLRADAAPGPLVARVDVPHLKQALLNLMLNAVDAMAGAAQEQPRELIIRTERRTPQRPRGAARLRGDGTDDPAALIDAGHAVAVHVIDTGPGITPEQRERIFQPYFTTKSGGTGLGLPTTRRLIEAHGGRIDVHTEPGRGSDFVIVLPAEDVAAAAS